MEELIIKTHNFEDAKNKIKLFAETEIKALEIKSLKEKGWFFNNNVTAAEHNEAMLDIMKFAMYNNEEVRKTIKEFLNIYNAFETLDKDYIQGIRAGVKGAKKASNQASEAATKAEKNTIAIKQLIKTQNDTIEELLNFKEEIEKIEHILDIEKIWNDVQKFKNQIENIKSDISKNKKRTDEQITKQEQQIIKQKEDIIELLNELSSNVSKKLNETNQKQTKQNQDFKSQISSIQLKIDEYKNKTYMQIEALGKQIIKQNNQLIIAYVIVGIFCIFCIITLAHIIFLGK